MGHIRVSLIIAALFLFSCLTVPAPPAVPTVDLNCTAAGCANSFQVDLQGEAPSDFVLIAESSTGERVSVHCLNGMTEYDAQTTLSRSPICTQSGVSLLNFTPNQVTISVRWEESEVSHIYRPSYRGFYPNGPACEPECVSAQVDFDLLLDWQTYSDRLHGYSFRYPPNLNVRPIQNSTSYYVGEKIQIGVSDFNPLECRGDCPVIQEATTGLILGGSNAIRIEGYIGSIGGNVPQEYVGYIIPRADSFHTFTMYALAESGEASITDFSRVYPMNPVEVELFEQIMATFHFTN